MKWYQTRGFNYLFFALCFFGYKYFFGFESAVLLALAFIVGEQTVVEIERQNDKIKNEH